MIEVDPGKVYRGPRPESLSSFQNSVIKSILNLEIGTFLPKEFGNLEFIETIKIGRIPLHMPLVGFMPPNKAELDACLSILTNALYLPVYVHCHFGVDRTGVVVAAYRVKVQRWTIDQAFEEMFQLGFHKDQFDLWLPTVRETIQSL